MSRSHKHNLPIIKSHLFTWGFEHCWAEVRTRTGERPDLFAVAGRDVEGTWTDDYGQPSKVIEGQTIVAEYKDSVADVRADRDKACRQHDVLALGDWRYYWIRRDGNVRPDHIDEGNGWGVVLFDNSTCEVVRPSARFARVARWETLAQVRKLLQRDHHLAVAATRDNLSTAMLPSVIKTTSAPRSETIREDSGKYVDRHAKAAEAYVSEGPCTTAQLMRHLEEATNWKGSPTKLTQHLKSNSNTLQAPAAGGNWTIKSGGAS